MPPTDVSLTKEFNARLFLPSLNCRVSITSENKNDVQKLVERCLDFDNTQSGSTISHEQTRFETVNPTNVMIYNPRWKKGNQPIGKISEYVTTEALSIHAQLDKTERAA